LSHMYCLRNRDILEDKHPGIVIIKIPVFHADKIEGRIGSLNVAIDISQVVLPRFGSEPWSGPEPS
jgi:hypothetical protein